MAERPQILICSCEDTMPLDAEAVRRGCRGSVSTAHHLCRTEIERFRAAAAQGNPLIVGCTQEAPLFSEIAADLKEPAPLTFVNVRETAGWSSDAAKAGPKMAALIAAAAEPVPDFPLVSLSSEGVTLVYGRDERAIEAARLLAEHLDVTVLVTRPKDLAPPRVTEFPVVKGTIRSAKGHLGAFELVVDDYAAPAPSSRGVLTFGVPRDGAMSRCDLIVDLSGGAPLFPAHDLRDGYLRADPEDAGRGAACRAQGARPHRHLRQAALRGFYRRALRAFAFAHRRLPPLSRSLPDRRDHAGRQSCVDRSEHLRRLRAMRRGLPDRRRRLRAAARRHAAAQAACTAHDLRAGGRHARDRAAARRAARRAVDRGARAPWRRLAGERAAARR